MPPETGRGQPRQDRQTSALPRSLLRFYRELRDAGVAVSTSAMLDALNATTLVDIFDKSEFRNALRTTLVKRHEDFDAFDRLFELFWEIRSRPGNDAELMSGQAPQRPGADEGTMSEKGRDKAMDGPTETGEDRSRPQVAATAYSPYEVLRKGDLSALKDEQLDEIERALRQIALQIATVKTRRLHVDGMGTIDLRKTARSNVQYGMELLKIYRRRRAIRKSKLLIVCDVSGSMKTHSSFAMQYLYALGRVFARVEVFVFSTKLTKVTPGLRSEGFEGIKGWLSDSVSDWGGGTKIGACLDTLLADHGNLIDSKTVVIIVSDGMDTGDTALLEEKMRTLMRRSRSVIWLNPLLADPQYQPICRGMQAALPYVDTFMSANSVADLRRLAHSLRNQQVIRSR